MIELKNLNFAYTRYVPVLSGLSLSFSTGAICGLLGKNGVGKTTLLQIFAGLQQPTTVDKISVMGHEPFKREVSFLGKIFFLPEEFSLPRCTIVEYANRYGRFYPNFSLEALWSYLEEFEVSPNAKLHLMSFGQRKKAYIAFGFATGAELLLLDEPTNGLDITSKTAFRRAVARLADSHRTIIISTHQVRDLEEVLDHIVILKNNAVLLNASSAEITRRLRFEVVAPDTPTLYSERSIHGTIGIVENHEQSETNLDIEMLFNAVNGDQEKFSQIFNK